MTKAERQHLDDVAQLGCVVCLNLGHEDTPAELHHIRTGGHGEAFHAGPRVWQLRFGREEVLLKQVGILVRQLRATKV